MDSYLVHLVAVVLAGLLPTGVGYWIYRRGRGRPARLFAVLLTVIALQVEGLALQLAIADPAMTKAIFHLRQAAALFLGPLWLVFALDYTGTDRWLTRRALAALGAITLVFVASLLTNPIHHLTYPTFAISDEPFTHLTHTTGPLYWLALAVTYVMLVIGLALLFRLFLQTRFASRRQTALIMVSALVAIAINVAENAGALPVEGFEYTVFGTSFFSAVAGLAIFSYQLFDVSPLARDAVVETIDDLVIVVDDEGRVVDVNRAARETFPALDEGVGSPLAACVPDLLDAAGVSTDGTDAADTTGRAEDASTDGGGTGGHAAHRLSEDAFADAVTVFRDGTRHTFSVGVTALATGPDRRAFALVCKDVTDLREYARQLEQQTEQLDRVAGTISHDLRNPLTVAQGAVQLAREGDESELERASEALDRMGDIVGDTLALARAGEGIGERELVSLADVARAAWETSDTGDATLTVAVDDDWQVYADEGRLRTAMENLFRNAQEHGGEDVAVRVSRTDDGAGFAIADDGPGVPDDARGRLFEPGFSTEDTGTGLGLAIVDAVATAHGWTVQVESGPDGGARFVIRDVDLVRREDADVAADDD